MSTVFQSTPPARGATEIAERITESIVISIHAPREGGDGLGNLFFGIITLFQSTPPARGATLTQLPGFSRVDISIHAPREGGD